MGCQTYRRGRLSPAGMLDGSGNFRGVAAEEIQEECHIVISENELVDLTELAFGDRWRGMIPSAGGALCIASESAAHSACCLPLVAHAAGIKMVALFLGGQAATSSFGCTSSSALSRPV
jgi:hypothetical protein